MTNNNSSHKKILYGIIAAIIIGFLTGGFLPSIAKQFSILGELFLNLLMMIVVPLVMLSIIVGITNLGDIRKIGGIGKRTILYYFATTGLSVLVGLLLVNIIQPGKGVNPGEKLPELSYRIDDSDPTNVIITGEKLKKTEYGDKYILILLDQNLRGELSDVSPGRIRVKSWKSIDSEDVIYLKKNNGSDFAIHIRDEMVMSAELKPEPEGRGIEITIPISGRILGKKDQSIVNTIKDVLSGNKEEGREGLIPRNIFNAMQRMEILPLIFFALLFGAALTVIGEKGEKTIEIISGLNEAIMKIVDWIMYVAPFGIFGIISARIGIAGGFKEFLPELAAVGTYSFTVVLGLMIHGVIILPLILRFIGKRGPVKFLFGVGAPLLNAFSTASSSATLPLTLEAVEEQNGISKRTAGFVLPIGATINMDGTALYEAVAAMFIAQVYGIHLGPAEQVIIFLTATLAAIGAAGIPEAGLVTMVIVLKAVNLPIEGIGLILTVDWLLDRFRTTVNVWGDSVGTGVIETLENRAAKKLL